MAAGVVKVLLTEDESSYAEIISIMLLDSDQARFEVDEAPNLKSCLELLSKNEYQVALLDLHLPDSLGLDTVRSVRKMNHAIPIIAMTGLEDEELVKGALKAGAQDFFVKNELNAKLLTRVIRYAIDRRFFELRLEEHANELETRVEERTRQLQAAKEQWEKTFDAVPDLIAIIGKDYKILRANQALAQAAGTTVEKLVGSPCFHVMHGAEAPVENCPHQRLLKNGGEHVHEIHETTLSKDLLISTSPIEDERGRLLGSVHVARDISLIKEAQKKVAESERMHRMFMDRLPEPTVVYDHEGKVLYSNPAFERVFGWSQDELINRRIEFVPPDSMAETKEKIKRMMEGEPVVDFGTQRLTKDGRRLNVLLNSAPLFLSEAGKIGNIVILRDMTAIRRAEEARKASEQKFQELVESMNEGLTIADPDGRIVYANAKFCDMLGYPAEGIAGMLFTDLLDENSRENFAKQWEKRQTGEERRYEVALNKRDGGSVFVIVSPKILRNSDGKMTSSLAIMTDMTERKNLESQLIQAQKLESIGQLAAGIAHEINTPTQYVSSNTGFLEEAFDDLAKLINAHMDLLAKLEEREQAEEEVAQLRKLAEELDFDFLAKEVPSALSANKDGLARIAKIVLSIKEFAHPGQDDKLPADLNKAIENTITVARNEWKYVAEVKTDLDPDLPPVPCVVGELNQVVLNLIVNAAHAIAETVGDDTEKKGLISIATKQRDGFVEISISDNGPGIPEAIRNRIFDPFFTTKEPGKGTGQGLAIAYRTIVDNHQGKISLENQQGGGAKFTIRLPLEI